MGGETSKQLHLLPELFLAAESQSNRSARNHLRSTTDKSDWMTGEQNKDW